MDAETLERLSEAVRLPFEERCQHANEYHLRNWPGGRPVTVNPKIRRRRTSTVGPSSSSPTFDEWMGSLWHLD